jgi:hypothetical protein
MRVLEVVVVLFLVSACGRSVLDDGGALPDGSLVTANRGGDGANAGGGHGDPEGDDASPKGDDANPGATAIADDGGTTSMGPSSVTDSGTPVNGGDASSTASGSCGPLSCSGGCCLPDGSCYIAGISPPPPFDACGSLGESCTTCPAGYECPASQCVREVERCGPSNCDGCCLPPLGDGGQGDVSNNDLCYEGTQDGTCGQGGGTCTRCDPVRDNTRCAANDGRRGPMRRLHHQPRV